MRREWLAFVLLLASASGCDAVACRDKTIYLTFNYEAAVAADTLTLDITIGSVHRHYERPRTPGKTRDTLEVLFQGYLAGETLVLAATATRDGQTVGRGQATQMLDPGCSALTLALAAAGAPGDADAGGATADLAGGTQMPADLSMSPSAPADMVPAVPTLVFSGLDNTAESPSSNMGVLYEDRCPPGAALIGFNFSATNEIDNDWPICAQADLLSMVGGGWTAIWGPTTFLPYHGYNGDPGNQRLCPVNSFVRGFTGTSAFYLQSVMMLCSAIVVSQNKQVSLSADSYSMSFGPSAGSNFGPNLCPSGQVATMRRERQDTKIPAYAFGLACSSITAN